MWIVHIFWMGDNRMMEHAIKIQHQLDIPDDMFMDIPADFIFEDTCIECVTQAR